MKRSTFIRSGIALAAAAAISPSKLVAQTPEASPAASPVAGMDVPQGPLGEQALWILEVANAGPGSIKAGEIEAHFHESFFEETTMPEVYGWLSDLQSAGITYEIEPNSFISTMDLPASNGRFILVGSDGSRTLVSLQIERDSGLIVGLLIQPATDGATPDASPVG
jgi:hypothetical protein